MPQFIEWIMSNFFIVIIILGALFSVFGKKKAQPNGGSEPFGGRAASRQNTPPRRVLPANGEQERRSPFAGAPAQPNRQQVRGSDSGESRGAHAERKNPGQISRQMKAEIDKRLREQRAQQRRMHSVENAAQGIGRAAEGGIAGATSNAEAVSPSKAAAKAPASSVPNRKNAAQLVKASSAEELRKGLLWAEVLGAPRARKPYSSGRR